MNEPFTPLPDAGSSRVTAYVGLGSNMGDPAASLRAARRALAALPGIAPLAASPVYRTEPQGMPDQPFFLNQVVALSCPADLAPEDLLDRLLALERGLGRVRPAGPRHGPRVIDLDLLLFGDACMYTERLTLPHPRMLERAFVLVPLADIAPDLPLPRGGRVRDRLDAIRYSLHGDVILQSHGLAGAGPGGDGP